MLFLKFLGKFRCEVRKGTGYVSLSELPDDVDDEEEAPMAGSTSWETLDILLNMLTSNEALLVDVFCYQLSFLFV